MPSIFKTTLKIYSTASAKKGLLNTVNTEFHKRAFDKLENLSQELISEFDPDSKNYWASQNTVRDTLKDIHKTFQNNKEELVKEGEYSFGILVRPDAKRLDNLIQRTKSDPFIPSKVRDYVTQHLETRVNKLNGISFKELEKYANDLVKGKVDINDPNAANRLHNKINDRLYKEGCGIGQVEEEVHKIRIFIQKYLEGFNPIK